MASPLEISPFRRYGLHLKVPSVFSSIAALLLCACHGFAQSPVALKVNTASREETRDFYNGVYAASENVPMNSSADTLDCVAGTNSDDFQEATLRRINWFRAMAGIPPVIFTETNSAADQSAALMMSANGQLLIDDIPPTWSCFDPAGTNAAHHSNLLFGQTGPDAIKAYMWEAGATNTPVGHRRWMLYPQTQTMAAGDVPFDNGFPSANATWVVDTNYGGPRPPTTWPFVAWPPPGYAPYPIVYPRWSFALSNADFTNVVVTMRSNGMPLDLVVEANESGFGEHAVAWYPSSLDPIKTTTVFPFSGEDTTYDISIGNIGTTNGPVTISYAVTVFDPAKPGADAIPVAINGTNRPSANENNPYTCVPSANPNNTGYQWLTAQTTNGNLIDNAGKGLTNFTIFPTPLYPLITNSGDGTGKCFHLTHTNPAPQLLQLREVLFPKTNSFLRFRSCLSYATSNEEARVQVSTNSGATWEDIFTQQGSNGRGQTAYVSTKLSLAQCAGQPTLVRFNYDYRGGAYYAEIAPYVGWRMEAILFTNTSKLAEITTTATLSTNFNFSPPSPGNWIIQARSVIFGQFAVGGSPVLPLTAVSNPAPMLFSLQPPIALGSQIQVPFVLFQGAASHFQLLEAGQVGGPWTVDSDAVLSHSIPRGPIPGSFFQFTTATNAAATFYRVQAAP
jgi:hypothetical protein